MVVPLFIGVFYDPDCGLLSGLTRTHRENHCKRLNDWNDLYNCGTPSALSGWRMLWSQAFGSVTLAKCLDTCYMVIWHPFVGFEVFTVVVMKRIIFWDMTPCSPLSLNRRFGGNRFSKPASKHLLNLFLRPWRWRRYVPPKRRLKLNGLHSIISQMILFWHPFVHTVMYLLFPKFLSNAYFIMNVIYFTSFAHWMWSCNVLVFG
jgi:hypothetical protein